MDSALERLAELVRRAEARSRSQKLIGQLKEVAEQFRQAVRAARVVDHRVRAMRPQRLRQIEEADREEQQLKDLVRRVAQLKSHVEQNINVEELIDRAQAEIEQKRRLAREDLEDMENEQQAVQKELQTAVEEYRQLRLELDRLEPDLGDQFAEEDRLLIEAEPLLPGGQLQALKDEIEQKGTLFGQWEQREQYLQLKVWIGRLRRLQRVERNEEEQALAKQIFSMLVELSKQHQPGYIEAFQHTYQTNWDAFIADAQRQLQELRESRRRQREATMQQQQDQEAHESVELQSGSADLRHVAEGRTDERPPAAASA